MIRFILATGIWLSLVQTAKAQERFELFTGVRSLGMGGVQVVTVNDETALIANPAALGRLRNFFLTVADPELELGAKTQSVIGADIMAFIDPQETLDALNDKPNKNLYMRAQMFPSFVVPNFGIGVFGSYRMAAELNEAATELEMNYRNDLAVVTGFNFRLWDGRIKLGFNVRGMNRVELIRDDIPATTTGADLKSLGATEGFGIASDVGLMLAAPVSMLPTLGIVYRDVGRTHYDMNDGFFLSNNEENPETTPATLDVGFGFFPIIGKRNRMAVGFEYRDVLDAYEEADGDYEIMRRLHGGVEFNFSDFLFIRAGANQGYWTAGVEVAMLNYQLQAATYGEEVGDAVTQEEDRRYVFKFAWRF